MPTLLLAGLALAGPIDGRAAVPDARSAVTAPAPQAGAGNRRRPAVGIYEALTVGRVVWPVDLKPARAGGCEDIAPAHIRVREDGESRRVTAVDPRRLPTIHAILIDTSGSMMRWEAWTRQAAAEYSRGLPPDDRAMLATFDESLILRAPLAFVTESFLEPMEPMEDRLYTALWDALAGLLHYLEGRPERKILIVVTDGCDSVSLPIFTDDTVLAQAEAMESLTILPVFLGGHTQCPHGMRRFDTGPTAPLTVLESLARRTGGEVFRLTSLARMEASFQEIRRRLDREGTIVYEDIPFGEGGDDAPERRDAHRRRVKIQDHDLPGCRVRSAGPPRRLVTRTAREDREAAPRSRFHWEEGELVGEIKDLVISRGALYDADALARGRYMVTIDRRAATAPRTVTAAVPPFVESVRKRGGLGAFLLQAPEETSPAPDLVQGLSFLGVRGDLGLALLEAPGYGEWARLRIRSQRERQADELLAEYGGTGAVTTGARVAVRRAFMERPLTSAEVSSLLAEWLGDIPARKLATSMERHAGGELLACRAAPAGEVACVDEISRRLELAWDRIREWFPPPTQVRVRVPLVPFYDPERDLFGFYRVLLPRPAVKGGPPADAIPPRPAGFELLRWRMEAVPGARSLAGAAGVKRIRYPRPTRSERTRLRDWLFQSEGAVITREQAPLTVVEVVLNGEGERAGPALPRGFLYREGWKPEGEQTWRLCVGLDRSDNGVQCTVVGSLRTNGAI
jgi:hypothetical protein